MTVFFKKRSTVWMEIPDPSTKMAQQPKEQSISSEEKGGGESPEVDQVSQVGSTAQRHEYYGRVHAMCRVKGANKYA